MTYVRAHEPSTVTAPLPPCRLERPRHSKQWTGTLSPSLSHVCCNLVFRILYYVSLFFSLWVNTGFFCVCQICLLNLPFRLIICRNDQGQINKNRSTVLLTGVISRRKLSCLSLKTFITSSTSVRKLNSFAFPCHSQAIRTPIRPIIPFRICMPLYYYF